MSRVSISCNLLLVFCLSLVANSMVNATTASTYVYFKVDGYTGSTCSNSRVIRSFFPYVGECWPQSTGQLKWTEADSTGVTLCSYNAPVSSKGCSSGYKQTCTKIAYGSCAIFPAQYATISINITRVFINPDADPPTHYTVMSWPNKCDVAPSGKLPGEVPTPNSLGIYPFRQLIEITDAAGNNPPTGACETGLCGSAVCWAYKTSSTAGTPPAVHVCSNGYVALGGTTCAAATYCSTFTLDGTACVDPTYQPFMLIGSKAKFDVVLPGDESSKGEGVSLAPFPWLVTLTLLVLIVTI